MLYYESVVDAAVVESVLVVESVVVEFVDESVSV